MAAVPQPGAAPRRRRETRRSVLLVDRVADWGITVGGMLVIVAIFGIMVFLFAEVVPLFRGGQVLEQADYRVEGAQRWSEGEFTAMDEYRGIALHMDGEGVLQAFHVGTGRSMEVDPIDLGGVAITAMARTLDGHHFVLGFADGSMRLGQLHFRTSILAEGDMPSGLVRLDDRDASDGRHLYSRIPGRQVRRTYAAVELSEAEQLAPSGVPLEALSLRVAGTRERPTQSLASLDAEGSLRISRAETRMNLLTGATTTRVGSAQLPPLPPGTEVKRVLVTGQADQVFVATRSGQLFRYDTRRFDAPILAEALRVTADGASLTAIDFLIGQQTLLVGADDGSVSAWFRLPARNGGGGSDGQQMVRAKEFRAHAAPILAFAPSQRGKSFISAAADGAIWLRHSTSEQVLLQLNAEPGMGRGMLMLAPREDVVLALDPEGSARAWRVSVPHPETTWRSIFGKVWYEGFPEPVYAWQSSSGSDSFEPKLSLVPLIFGTLKGTVYALLFAVPIALLAAIFTSEFLHPNIRATVKPTIEIMAALPSVVLGFIAALILAPLVETWIAAVLLAFIAVPLGLLFGAFLWQALPPPWQRQMGATTRLLLMLAVLLGTLALSRALGPAFERVFFGGDFLAWVDGGIGSARPLLGLLLLPLAIALAWFAASRLMGERMRALASAHGGAVYLVQWLGIVASGALLAWVGATVLTMLGFDLRGGVVDTYAQRNTLVVSFAMGFAVIPIIYTIAEDALSAVPEHLRAASLALGGTQWQTAIYVILPTAFSGIFAAVMIGMGRAVGETMIVVMAAGNTPLMEWNVFSGLRALSANIAVELPEAVQGSTLYRMLFLAGLTLFVITFVLNTAAEAIRLRFRARATQL
jgi:phosphate transport system permease protein